MHEYIDFKETIRVTRNFFQSLKLPHWQS